MNKCSALEAMTNKPGPTPRERAAMRLMEFEAMLQQWQVEFGHLDKQVNYDVEWARTDVISAINRLRDEQTEGQE
jgi:hypothetical protein